MIDTSKVIMSFPYDEFIKLMRLYECVNILKRIRDTISRDVEDSVLRALDRVISEVDTDD